MRIFPPSVQISSTLWGTAAALSMFSGLGNTAAAAESASAVSQGMGSTVRANPWDPMTAHAAQGQTLKKGAIVDL